MAKILYIEDDKLLRESTEMLLVRFGHSVIPRVDTRKADALVDLWQPDLIITDHNLGGGKETGLEMAKRLKEGGYKVAMLSACPHAHDDAKAIGIPFFYKPHNIAGLLSKMGVEL